MSVVPNIKRLKVSAKELRSIRLYECSVLFSVPDGRKIAQFATFVRPPGRTKVTNWHYFPSLPTSIHQIEPPNDIIIETKLTLTLTLTLNPKP